MERLLKGAPVAEAILDRVKEDASSLMAQGIVPTLAIVRVGARPDDLSYERGVAKRALSAGILVRNEVLPEDTDSAALCERIRALGEAADVHGILLFQPLPGHLDGEAARQAIAPEKDVDGCTEASMTGVYAGRKQGFAPCTAQAVMEILHHYRIPISGKKAAVIGRSLVIGRPAAMLLMQENATVTICHTRTVDVPAITREADIVVAASGQMESIGAGCFSGSQVVIDVGINWNEEKGKLCGDVDFDEALPVVSAITPVPGGVGAVTTAVLLSHVVEAAGCGHVAEAAGHEHVAEAAGHGNE